MSVEWTQESAPKRIPVDKLDARYLAIVRHLIASNQFASEDSSRVLGVTSSLDGEGTSTVATNIALTMAGLNAGPVLLVDANDAKPSLHKLFGMSVELGLQNALSGERSPLECVTSSPLERLSLVLNGKLERGKVAIYSTSSIDELLDEWKDTFKWIVFDLPPPRDTNVSALLASRLDGVLLVVEADRVDRNIAERTCSRLRQANVNLLGSVYNKSKHVSA